MKSFEQQVPHLASWVQDGWIEIGITNYHASFIRVLDEGGMIWSDEEESYESIDHALAAADRAVQAWCRIHMPDLIIGQHGRNVFTLEEGQYLAFIYNYTHPALLPGRCWHGPPHDSASRRERIRLTSLPTGTFPTRAGPAADVAGIGIVQR
jgi:hypothetical protein